MVRKTFLGFKKKKRKQEGYLIYQKGATRVRSSNEKYDWF